MNLPNKSNSMTWIESTGGPLILVENNLLRYWQGSNAAASDYDRACRISDYVALIEVGPGIGVVLGEEPFSTTWWPSSDLMKGFLLRWVYAEEERKVRQAVESLSIELSWEPTSVNVEVTTDRLILFDSSYPGTDIDAHLTIEIPPDRYRIETLHYKPNQELYLILHRFVPARG